MVTAHDSAAGHPGRRHRADGRLQRGSGSSTVATSATSSADAASGTPACSATPASSVPANARRAAQLVNQWTACICPGIRCQRGSRTRLLQEVRCTWRGPLLYLVDLRWAPGGLPRVLAAPGRRAGLGAGASAFVRERGSGSYQGPHGGPGPRRARRLPVPRARTGELPGEHAVARATARQAPGRRGNLPRTGSPATGRPVVGIGSIWPSCG
jgi:hypothetical protein